MRAGRLLLAVLIGAAGVSLSGTPLRAADSPVTNAPQFSRHVVAVFSRLGCNAGSCHGAVQGKNGFRLSLFGAKPERDYEELIRGANGRRLNRLEPEQSLLLLKATMQVAHGGGRRMRTTSPEYEILKNWITSGCVLDNVEQARLSGLDISPREQSLPPESAAALRVSARFADGTTEDVTALCSFESREASVAAVDTSGRITTGRVGEAPIVVRYRSEPAMAMVLVASPASAPFPELPANNFIDTHVLAKLRRLHIRPAEQCDDATFLRRTRLDITGKLPLPAEIREFLSDVSSGKRERKIEQLLAEPGHSALWTLKFCDLLRSSDFGIYADGLGEQFEALRFQAWVRARLTENIPYDEFAARILTATSRDDRPLEEWAKVVALQEGFNTPRTDLELYARRKSLDIYWQRRGAVGVSGALQVAHAFLGLRLECAQCHRHPHDVWQQDDLLSFANFFMRVRKVGFEGDNEKKYPADAVVFKKYTDEGTALNAQAKALKEGKGKELAEQARKVEPDVNRMKGEIRQHDEGAIQSQQQSQQRREQAAKSKNPAEIELLIKDATKLEEAAKQHLESAARKREQLAPLKKLVAEHETMQHEIRELERRGRYLSDDVPKRILHSQIFYRTDKEAEKMFASVTSPLGTQSSTEYRLLGEKAPVAVAPGEDPRPKLVEWLRRPDNPYFARAIVNRVWAHYMGRGLAEPADDMSPYNPATHPQLLEELCREFIQHKYDLRWLHRTIVSSRTYQQSSDTNSANLADRANYSHFFLRRLPAEVLIDAVNQATGTTEDPGMKYYHWPENLSTVELPYVPQQNTFLTFFLEQFGRPARNSSVQCDCERQSDASMLQILSIANHPRVWQKIADPAGRVAEVLKSKNDSRERIEELYLSTLGRLPDEEEQAICLKHLTEAESPETGLRSVLWSLLNTREFLLQH